MGTREKAVNFHLATWLAVLATLAYFFLATYRIDFQSIWYDEGLTLHYSSLPLVDGLRELASQSVHPPLYFAGLHFWLKVAGDSDFALRFPSAALGALLISASFLLGSKLADRWLGVIVAFVMASSPFLVYYGQEARMYTAVALLSTLAAAGAVEVARRGRGYRLCVVASALAVLTHYFAFLVLGSLVVVVAPYLALRRRFRDLTKWLASLAVVCLIFLPWAANLLRVAATHDDFWRDRLSFAGTLQDAILHFSLGEVAWPDNDLIGIFYVAVAVGLLGLVRRRLRLAVLASVLTLTVSFAALAIFPKATYVARYMLVVAPAYYLLVAAGVYNLATMLIAPRKPSPFGKGEGRVRVLR
ncbi:MAG: glycosyltransferase family 39 protein, partial [Chloroflexi bacterium]|nr:glycosyltransferase family 39 protein [Chloroflexota bacterium]